MPLTPEHVGSRVVVRRRLPSERGPSGAAAMSDVLGVLERFDDQVAVRREDGTLVTFPAAGLVAGKPVPPRASVRPRVDPEELERICSAGWPPVRRERVGGWVLRAAGGFTRRANSCLVAGEPDRPLPQALAAVGAFYAEQRLPAYAQVVAGSRWQDRLAAAGWRDPVPLAGGVLVQVTSLRGARRHTRPAPAGPPVRVSAELTEAWLSVFERGYRSRGGPVGESARTVLAGGGQVGLAHLGDPVVAVGRGVVTGDWLGLAAVAVDVAHRRRGHARAVVEALLAWGAEHGTSRVYLQVTPDNTAALRLYHGYGFRTHHRYVYAQPAA